MLRSVAGVRALCQARSSRRIAAPVTLGPARAPCPSSMKDPEKQPPRLDKASFQRVLELAALRLPARDCHNLMKAFAGFTLDRPRMRPIVADAADKNFRLLLLDERVQGTGLCGLRQDLQELVKQREYQVILHQVHLDYSHLSADQILRALLPDGMEVPGAFEGIGHIAHLNLKDEWLPYKHIIGEVILDKNPHIKTVVNKLGSIENEFRVFQMEVIAGESRFDTEVKQHGARFRLNFAEVYWNSRLEQEHARLVGLFKPGQVVADVMAGIGPFAIPAAQKGCKVLANDLNPHSFRYLQENVHLNKVQDRVQAFNMDGAAFIRAACSTTLSGPQTDPPCTDSTSSNAFFDHAVMNLPASAVSFLSAFRGACSARTWRGPLPSVHCYTFSTGEEDAQGVRGRVEAALGGMLDAAPDIHLVRSVAPNKRMLCVSFALPDSIAFASTQQIGCDDATLDAEHQPSKRQCLEKQ